MKNKLIMAVLSAVALSFISVPEASAGTETIQDYGGRDMGRTYNYAPRPRPVYFPPPPIGVGIYPRFGYYGRPWRFGYRRSFGFHRPFWRHRHWH